MKDWEKNTPDGEKANANTLIQKELGIFEEQIRMYGIKGTMSMIEVKDVGMNQIS